MLKDDGKSYIFSMNTLIGTMNRKISFYLALILVFIFTVVTDAMSELHPVNHENIIYLVNHGWHAGLVLKRTDIPDNLWPESKNFSHAQYLEIGWGDKDYYQSPNPHLGIAIKAILWPTSSVLHIVALNHGVTSYFPNSEIIEFRLSDDNFNRMIEYIAASHSKDPDDISKPIANGLYGHSHFYLAREKYHLFNTCNVWTAKALHATGCPINSALTITTEGLMSQARSCGIAMPKESAVSVNPKNKK